MAYLQLGLLEEAVRVDGRAARHGWRERSSASAPLDVGCTTVRRVRRAVTVSAGGGVGGEGRAARASGLHRPNVLGCESHADDEFEMRRGIRRGENEVRPACGEGGSENFTGTIFVLKLRPLLLHLDVCCDCLERLV